MRFDYTGPGWMCFGRDLFNCELGEKCERYDECRAEWLQLNENHEDEFEPERVNVNMFGRNP